jgi:hypothetical protein
MNVCKKRNFIFIHIPKNAGSSIYKSLGLKNVEHHTHKYIIDKQCKNLELDNMFQFAFARNPWDRFLSLYFYMFQGPDWQKEKDPNIIDFPTFVRLYCNDYTIIGHRVWQVHYKPQIEWLDLKLIDFIGRFESLQEDFNTVCDRINIPRKELPHQNKTNHKHYSEYYNKKTRDMIAKKYKEDIEYFGYEFGE